MNRKTVILVIDIDTLKSECFSNLKKACDAHGFIYNTISRKLPVTIQGLSVQRVKFQ
jgi:hypothetical protein